MKNFQHLTPSVIAMTASLMVFTWSCREEVELPSISDENPEVLYDDASRSDYHGRAIVLGEQLENPYAVATMREAWANLRGSDPAFSALDPNITTSHLYIRFKPKNKGDIDVLQSDSTLVLFSYPLDFEIIRVGSYYHDPEVLEGQPTYQYCSVPVGKPLPSEIEVELLTELFIPEEVSDVNFTNTNSRVDPERIANALVDEALRITGHGEGGRSNSDTRAPKGIFGPSKWRPRGRVRVWDADRTVLQSRPGCVPSRSPSYSYSECPGTVGYPHCRRVVGFSYFPCPQTVVSSPGFIAIEGLRVEAYRWFRTVKGYVDSNGFFSADGLFRYPARYRVEWERHQFRIRDYDRHEAVHIWPEVRDRGLDWDIGYGEIDRFYADVFRAAYHYYYRYIQFLTRPPQNSGLRSQMRILAENGSDPEAAAVFHRRVHIFNGANNITIYRYGYSTGTPFSSEYNYDSTIHELAHASHYILGRRSDFRGADGIVKESWAVGVAWELTGMVYLAYPGISFGSPNYSPLVIDMIDGIGSPSTFNYGSNDPSIDGVKGYTISQIERSLKGKRHMDSWEEEIRRNHVNRTENELGTLFDHWNPNP